MKIALCFSGAIRDFNTCIASIKKYLIHDYDIDIFLHLWEFDYDTSINYKFKWRQDTCKKERVIELLKPKLYVIDKYNSEWETKIIKEANINTNIFSNEQDKNYGFNCCSMYYKIRECFKLAEKYSHDNNIKYDLYVRARLDFIWEDYIDLKTLNENKVYLIKDRYATQSKIITNDKFFAGPYNIMKTMCNIFNCLKKYQTENITLEGQTINNYHILQNKLDYQFIGHSNTYYKCMRRHQLNYKIIKLIFDTAKYSSKLVDEIAYNFLSNGYYVDYINNNYNSYFINCNDKNFIGIIYDISFDVLDNYISINFITNTIKINKNLIGYEYDIFNFLQSLLEDDITDNNYIFDTVKQITNINNDERIIYKYRDSGYYILPIIIKDNEYYIDFLNKIINIKRNTFKIKNIHTYYSDNILPC